MPCVRVCRDHAKPPNACRWAAPALDGCPGHGTWYTRTVFATSPICPGSRRCRSASRRSAERVLQRRPRARLGAGGETRRSSAIAAHQVAPLTADAARLADKLRGPVERVARPGRQVCPSLATGQCRRSTRAGLIVQRSWFMSRSACASRPTLAEFLVQACVPQLSPKTVSVGARAPCRTLRATAAPRGPLRPPHTRAVSCVRRRVRRGCASPFVAACAHAERVRGNFG